MAPGSQRSPVGSDASSSGLNTPEHMKNLEGQVLCHGIVVPDWSILREGDQANTPQSLSSLMKN